MQDSNLLSERFAANSAPYRQINAAAALELEKVRAKITNHQYVFAPRPCPGCRSVECVTLSETERYGLPICKVLCRDCGLVRTNPDMREQDYEDFYREHYRELYFGDLVGSPEKLFRAEVWRGQAIRDYLTRRKAMPKEGLVIDVGCGAGGVLSVFQNEGFDVLGVDYGAENLEYASTQGIPTRLGGLGDAHLSAAPNLVIYSHVLEHIQDLDGELRVVRKQLANTGYLYIEVPGILNVRWNYYRGDLLRAFHIAHIYDFSLNSLTRVVERNGFVRVAGDECIRALFKRGESNRPLKNDFAKISQYLHYTEQHFRAFFILSGMKLTGKSWLAKIRSMLVRTLKTIGLYGFAKFVKRRLV